MRVSAELHYATAAPSPALPIISSSSSSTSSYLAQDSWEERRLSPFATASITRITADGTMGEEIEPRHNDAGMSLVRAKDSRNVRGSYDVWK